MYNGSLCLWRGTLAACGLNLAIRHIPLGSHCVLRHRETHGKIQQWSGSPICNQQELAGGCLLYMGPALSCSPSHLLLPASHIDFTCLALR